MPDRRTLLLLTNVYPFRKGEEFVENEIRHLADGFARVVVIATQTRPGDVVTRSVPANVEIIRAGGPRPSHRAARLAALRGLAHLPRGSVNRTWLRNPRLLALEAMFECHARDTEADLLHHLPESDLRPGSHAVIYSYWFLDTARVASLLASDLRARGVAVDRLVSRAHGYDLYADRTALGHLPERRTLLEAFDAVCPVSDSGTRTLKDAHPAYRGKVHTRRLGTVDPGEQAHCRRRPFTILTCASLIPVKRMTRMPGIMAELRGRGVDARWTHLGSGPQLETIRAAVHDAGLEDVTSLRGHLPNTEVIAAERSLHPSCLVNLSASEGLPVSMMEAASLGIPIVGTDVGGVSEIIHDKQNGRLLPAGFTDDQAVDALWWLSELPDDRYDAVCRAARRTWQSDYDEAVVYPSFCSEVLGASGS